MTRDSLAIISFCYGFGIAMVFMSLFDFFRKGGTRDLRNELDVEVELNIKLLKQIEDHRCAKVTINGQEVANIATINFDVSSNGARNGASGNPGHVDTRLASPFEWVCDKRGHKFAHEVYPRRCVFCGVSE